MTPKIPKHLKGLHRPTENRFLQYSLVLTAFCLLTVSLIYFLAYRVITGNLKQSLIQIAEQGSARVQDRLDGYLNILEAISTIDTIKDPAVSWHDKQQILRSIASRKYLNLKRISLADETGRSQTIDGAIIHVQDRAYFQKAITGQRCISEPLISRVDGTSVIIFAVPVSYQGRTHAVLYATHSPEALCDITDGIRMSRQSYSFIINQKGQVIAHPNRALVNSGENIFVDAKKDQRLGPLVDLQRQMIAGKTGAGEYFYQGIQKYMGFVPIAGTDWSFAITASKKSIFGPMNDVFIVLAFLVFLVFLLFLALNLDNFSLQQSLSHEKNILNSAVDTAHIIMIETNQDGVITAFNQYAEEFLAFHQNEPVGKINLSHLVAAEHYDRIANIIQNMNQSQEPLRLEFPIVNKSGQTIHLLWSINSNRQFMKGIRRFIFMGVDITERVTYEHKLLESNQTLSQLYRELAVSENELRRLAYYDPLTGLANRFSLLDKSAALIAGAEANHSKLALLYLDIDNFKRINDTFGHSLGDSLLLEIGNRLRFVLDDGQIFRLGGDEFVAIIPKISDTNIIFNTLTKLMADITRPCNIQGHTFYISVSIGVTIFPENGQNIEELMKNADTAMYNAKESGKNSFVFFDRSMNDCIVEKVNLESILRTGLEQHSFTVAYQPQVETLTGKIAGFEALIRWQNPEFHNSPDKMIQIAEETGLIIPIGLWVLEESCRFAAKLQAEGIQNLVLSINISTRQFLQNSFVSSIKEIIAKMNVPPQNIALEITETALMESVESNLDKLRKIHDYGINIHLDDFGTGYSSLNYLRNLPINILKIDKSFVADIHHGSQPSLIATIIALAHQMGLAVIAEGVETHEQLQFLANNHCDLIQGFLFSKPVPEEEAIRIAHTGYLKAIENDS